MILENLMLAYQSLKSNKMRALLTMLGIIIGIMSIIAIMIIGDAMTASVQNSLSSLGTNNITLMVQEKSVETFMFTGMGTVSSGRTGKVPTSDDLISNRMIEDMREYFADEIVGISLSFAVGSAQAKDGDLYANVTIVGTNADYLNANNVTILEGRFTSEGDVTHKNQTAVVSDKFVNNMFPEGVDPIGREVKIYKKNSIEIYTIIGVYKYEQVSFGGTASERDITTGLFIPVTTAKQDVLEKNFNNVTVIGAETSDVNSLTNRIQRYFDKQYQNNKDWKLSAFNMTSMLDAVTSAMGNISLAIAFIAGISLLVGGIGVMNIMLVSVTERTREIGTRKALGAKTFHIQLQFVTEAILISSVGGVIGLILGILVGVVISSVFEVPLIISPFVTIGSVLFSMVIGIFFGLYPANKAAKLDPIEALRYE